MKNDAHQQNVYGPKLCIETDNPENGAYGQESFSIKGTNDQGNRFILAHHENKVTRMETEQTLQVDLANKLSKNDQSLEVTCWNGKADVVVQNGNLGLKSKTGTITLDADEIILKARTKVVIGGVEKDMCKEVFLNATKIQAEGSTGNVITILAQHLLAESFMSKAFAGSPTNYSVHPAAEQGVPLRRV